MNATGLSDPLRHNAWANKELIAFCARLTPEQLDATSTGTYGTILSTLQHIVGAESRYLLRLTAVAAGWTRQPEEETDLASLATMAADCAARWDALATSPFDDDRTIHVENPQNVYDVKAGVLVAQAINHGNEHRSQINTILTTIGLEPPNLDGWTYGEATGRFVILKGDA